MQEQCDAATATKLCNRAMRRRKARLQQDILLRAAQGPGSGKPRMLETHVWHAKRMQMILRCIQLLCDNSKGALCMLRRLPSKSQILCGRRSARRILPSAPRLAAMLQGLHGATVLPSFDTTDAR